MVTDADVRFYLGTLAERLPMFVVTDHPTDWPDFYVARLHLTLPADTVLPWAVMDRDLDALRLRLSHLGFTRLDRSPGDDPVILEVWL